MPAAPVPRIKSLLASRNGTLLAGRVQNTSFVPALKLVAESLFELEMTVVLASVSVDASVTVPRPTSHSSSSRLTMA